MHLPRVSVITVNYNGTDDTLACLESLRKCTYPDFEVWVVDNGSQPTEVERLQEGLRSFPDSKFHILYSPENLGFGGGNNLAIDQVLSEGKSKYVYLLNNDTETEPDFLEKAVFLAESDPAIGIVNSLCLQFDDRTRVENAGHELLDCGDSVYRGRGTRPENHPAPVELLGASGAAVLYRTETLKQCGTFDASFFLNYEDADLSLRCVLMGWKCMLEPRSVAYHKVNASIRKVKDYGFYVRSQYNQFRSYHQNVPYLVVILNLPFIILRDVGVIVLNLVFCRWTILRVFLHARLRFFRNVRAIRKIHKRNLEKQKTSSWYFLKLQRNFIAVYARYFYEIIVTKRRSVFETQAEK